MGYRRTARNCLWTSWTFVRKPWLEDCFLYVLWQIQYLLNFIETIGWKWKISHAMPSQLLSNSSLLPQFWELTIIGRGWAKYHDLSVVSRLIICQSQRLRQIKWKLYWSARYWQIMIFCDDQVQYCFIIQSPSLFFNEYLREAKQSAFFTK